MLAQHSGVLDMAVFIGEPGQWHREGEEVAEPSVEADGPV
jgi:hypothetical protein